MSTDTKQAPVSAHTPGPWTIYRESDSAEWLLVMAGGPAGRIVANVNAESCPDHSSAPAFVRMPQEANARLISAAPDMLATLADASQLLAFDDDASVEVLRANIEHVRSLLCEALAKAEGRAP